MSDDGVAGVILPEITLKDGKPPKKPLFKVERGGMYEFDPDNCQHGPFILNDKWKVITCDTCGEKLDPYAVVSQYAEWWDRFASRKAGAEVAEKNMYVANLRRMRRLRSVTEEERDEMDGVLTSVWNAKRDDCMEMSVRIERAIRERKEHLR